MASLHNISIRSTSDDPHDSTRMTTINLVLAILAFVFFGFCLVGIFFVLRRRRRGQRGTLLPTYNKSSDHCLTITAKSHSRASNSVHVLEERRNLMENSWGPSSSPVPEIHITFPEEEEDSAGKKKGGCIVVVRIGDSGAIGMEPVSQDELPPYHSTNAERFQSLDLDRMGGLREKQEPQGWA